MFKNVKEHVEIYFLGSFQIVNHPIKTESRLDDKRHREGRKMDLTHYRLRLLFNNLCKHTS